jgi:hypothetical protein
MVDYTATYVRVVFFATLGMLVASFTLSESSFDLIVLAAKSSLR